MSPLAAALIITSAFMHASWNFISKRRSPSLAFFFVTTCCAALIISPLFVRYGHILSLIPYGVWALIVATGVAQMVYFFGLAGAYQRGDISLAYPLARALPVIMVAAISLLLGRGGEIGPWSLAGMALITIGCVILPLHRFGQARLGAYFDMVYLMALIAAIGTTGYSLIDDQILRHLRNDPAIQLPNREITLLFVTLQTTSTAIMLGVVTLLLRPERRQLVTIARNRSLLGAAAVTGVIVMATYGLVLASMAYVTDVSYVVAFRQLSIPIGALMGFVWQHEPRYRPKVAGIVIVSVGLVLVGMG